MQTQISEITVGAAWSDHLSALTQKHSLSLSTRQEKEKVLSLKSIMNHDHHQDYDHYQQQYFYRYCLA